MTKRSPRDASDKKRPRPAQQDVVRNVDLDVNIVCMLPRIAGWLAEGDLATKLVAPNTSSLGEVRVYITTRRNFTYVHTNYLKGHAEYPTKILSSAQHPLELLLANAIFESPDEAVGDRYHEFCDAMLNSFSYFVDSRALASTATHLRFHDLRHVAVVGSDGPAPIIEPLESWEARRATLSTSAAATVPPNPWVSGSFYLFSFLAVVASLYFISRDVTPLILPILLIGAILAATVIGAFTLKNVGELTDTSFLSLMKLALTSLPLLRRLGPENRADSSPAGHVASTSALSAPSSRYRVGERFRFVFGGTCRVTKIEQAEDGREYFTVSFDGDPDRTLTFPLREGGDVDSLLRPL